MRASCQPATPRALCVASRTWRVALLAFDGPRRLAPVFLIFFIRITVVPAGSLPKGSA
jgi:hypothetical protein